MIPPEADAEFVAGMEEVLDTYAEQEYPAGPMVCMDEQPTHLLTETRTTIPATKEHPKRVDYEYKPAGTASVFCEPKSGSRQVTVRDRRTKLDLAREVETFLRTRYEKAELVNLCLRKSEHSHERRLLRGVRPATARAIVKRIEFRCKPKHGSWLYEAEFSAMTRQCTLTDGSARSQSCVLKPPPGQRARTRNNA